MCPGRFLNILHRLHLYVISCFMPAGYKVYKFACGGIGHCNVINVVTLGEIINHVTHNFFSTCTSFYHLVPFKALYRSVSLTDVISISFSPV